MAKGAGRGGEEGLSRKEKRTHGHVQQCGDCGPGRGDGAWMEVEDGMGRDKW